MALDIVNLVKDQLTPSVISSVAGKLGESETGVSKAISGLVPTIVGGLVDKKDDAASMFDSLKGLASSNILSNLASSGEGNSVISSLLSKLFGGNLNSILSTIASFAGIKTSSANALMNISSAATFGSIGKYLGDNNIAASGLSSLFESQGAGLSKYLPSALSFSALGLGGLTKKFGAGVDAVKEKVSDVASSVNNDNKGGGMGWLKWLIGLIILVLIAVWLFRSCNAKKHIDAATDAVAEAADSISSKTASAVQSVKEAFTIDLDGITITANKGGIEEQMITFLKADSVNTSTPDQLKNRWFSFDNINFVVNKTDSLETGSMGQLENVAKILKKYNTAKIKIGGYTDKTGDAEVNKKVSQQRAEYLKKVLTDLGVGAQIVGAEGYGEEFATVDETASDEARAIDRKMAIRFEK